MWLSSNPSTTSPASSPLILVTSKNGASSISLSCSSDFLTVATSSSGRRSELPRPGKFFAITAILPSLPACRPRIYALPISPTQYGSPPNVRTPKSPFPSPYGDSSTSNDGLKIRLKPKADNSDAVRWPASSAKERSQVAPMAIWEGIGVSPLKNWS